MNSHKFETQIAIDYDVETALLLETISFWLAININNKSKKHYHDGRWWLYNTYNEWINLLPYYTAKQMRRIIANAKANDLILISNYNKRQADNTPWYTLTDKALCYFPILKEQILSTPAQMGRPPAQMGRALPDPNPDTKPDSFRENARANNEDFLENESSIEPQNQIESTPPQTTESQEMIDPNYEYPETLFPMPTHKQDRFGLVSTKTMNKTITVHDNDKFEEAWQAYPRKTAKEKCRVQWFHDGCHKKADEIIEKIKLQRKKDKTFIDGYAPSFHNYILDKRWDDEIYEGNKNKKFDHNDTSWADSDRRSIFE